MDVLKLLKELAHELANFNGGNQLQRMSDGLKFGSQPLTTDLVAILQSMRAYRGCGRTSLIDAITREFKFANRSDLAADLSSLLVVASDRLRDWEDHWSGIVEEFGDAVTIKQIQTPEYIPEDADYLGRIVGEVNLNAINDLALVQVAFDDVIGWIRQYVARETPSPVVEPAAVQQPAQNSGNATEHSRKKAKPSPWHDAGVTPPNEFKWELIGRKKDLTRWILGNSRPNAHRALDTRLRNGAFWGQQGDGDNWIVYFKDQKAFSRANTRKASEEASDT